MEYPDRFESAHVRHEDIDNHQIERTAFKRPQPGFTAIGDGYLEIVSLKINLDGHADHWIVVNDKNAWHAGSPRLNILFRQFANP
jgi:hypothetical protein